MDRLNLVPCPIKNKTDLNNRQWMTCLDSAKNTFMVIGDEGSERSV